ncbi:hypothetical protein CRG98_024822 [Punica granatum]|uniref:Uncharacterized protein n=1 Tax=Punica granatum TaxID=22663 RepID=A0A2I0JF00_PUNGR|nr:hypothetical protein CRG98_024822 [Punica granatum]
MRGRGGALVEPPTRTYPQARSTKGFRLLGNLAQGGGHRWGETHHASPTALSIAGELSGAPPIGDLHPMQGCWRVQNPISDLT